MTAKNEGRYRIIQDRECAMYYQVRDWQHPDTKSWCKSKEVGLIRGEEPKQLIKLLRKFFRGQAPLLPVEFWGYIESEHPEVYKGNWHLRLKGIPGELQVYDESLVEFLNKAVKAD